MPRFVSESETREIQAPWWGETETCTIRKFNYGDRQWLAGKTVFVGIRPGSYADGQVVVEESEGTVTDVLIGEMNLALLERGVAQWTDADGVGLPVTRAAIESLTEQDADFILSEITALNPRRARSKDDQVTFRGKPGGGAAAE